MTWVAVAVAGASIVGGVMSSNATKDAANTAANAQTQASQAGIAQQNKQFEAVQQLLSPFVQAGDRSLTQQEMLAGTRGADAQQAAITALQQTPAFTSQLKLGENRILANASATGGLRGGNTQAAIGMFAPQLLAQTINDQYSRLGGLTSIGQNAAAGVGNAGMASGNNVTSLLMAGGNAQANGALLSGAANARLAGSFSGALGQYMGAGGSFSGFGGSTAPSVSGNGFISDNVPMTGLA